MENTDHFPWLMGADMPHLAYLDKTGTTANDYSDAVRSKMAAFYSAFDAALTDGLTDEEYNELADLSNEILTLMKKERKTKGMDTEDIALLTIFSGIAAAIGLGKFFRS